MKTIILNTLATAIVVCNFSCMGQGQGKTLLAEQPKTVRAYSPEMNNMEMLTMTQMPGWQILAGVQWFSNVFFASIKGVNESANASFFYDDARGYEHSPTAQSATTNGRTVYLNVMSAADYLDYVFRNQFPNVQGAKRTKLTTMDMLPESELRELEELRVTRYNETLAVSKRFIGSENVHITAQTIDRASAEYRWVQDGDSVIHFMEVIINATYRNTVNPYFTTSSIGWGQEWLITSTMPVKNAKKMTEDINRMLSSRKWNEQFVAALNNIGNEGVQRTNAEIMRMRDEAAQAHLRHQQEMAQSQMRHQQNMAQQIMETQDYVANVRRDVNANRQASMERVNQGWRDAIVGVDRYMGADGKVLEVPVSMGSKVWQSAEGGTVYTSDSYLFNPIASLPDKDGIVREFRQLQLMK